MTALNVVAVKCGYMFFSGVLLAEGPVLVAQATGNEGILSNPFVVVGAWAGIGTAIGAAVGTALAASLKAFGDSILRPWLDNRGYKRERDELAQKVNTLVSVQDQMAVRMAALERDRDGAIITNRELTKELSAALADAYKLARHIGTMSGSFHHDDDVHLPPLVVGAVPKSQNGPRVLIVEDDIGARDVMAVMLKASGFRVDSAGTLGEAFGCLEADPDFIILDLMLPGGDGVEVLRAVRDRKMRTKVVVTTGKGRRLSDPILDPVRLLEPDFIITKPYNFEKELFPKLAAGFPPTQAALAVPL
jgi:CheY-like chemotaxis protein